MRRLIFLVCLSLLSTYSYASYAKAANFAAVEQPAPPSSPPVYVHAEVTNADCLKIAFPSIAMQAPEGVTTLSILISPNGEIIGGEVVKSSGSPALDNAAVAGLKKCLFKTATEANMPKYSWTAFEYVWKHDATTSPLIPLSEGMNKPPVYGSGPFYQAPSSGLPEGAVT